MSTKRFSPRKFRALAVMIADRMPNIDVRSLMHIMMHIDFMAYARLGRCITGAIWVRGDDYPIPFRSEKEAEKYRDR